MSSSDSGEESTGQQKAELVKKDKERIEAIRKQQEKALQALREEQGDVKDKTKEQKLELLMGQMEIFHQFVRGGRPVTQSPQKKKSGSRKRRDHLDEEEEIDDDVQDHFITRWTASPPFVKHMPMRNYQLHGLNWLIQLYDNGINGILADEMGLGKTLQSLSFLCYLKEIRGNSNPNLIIVPKSTLANWSNEMNRWVPSMKHITFHGDKASRVDLKKRLLNESYDAVITTYEMTLLEQSTLKKIKWKYMVIDEAHRIKNENSQLSQIVRAVKTEYRLLLTGTPLQNNLHELWALLNFLVPSIFSSSTDWEEWFTVASKEDETEDEKKERGKEVIERLHKLLKPFILRRRKAEVEKGIPPKTEIKVYVRMSRKQNNWYKRILEKDLSVINSGDGPKTRLQNILMQLRKVCNHPYLFPGAERGPPWKEGEHLIQKSGKLIVLDKLLARLKERGSRVLLFCQMTKVLDILEDYLILRKYEYCRIDGSTEHADRTSQIDEYNAEDSKKFIFLLSTRAGGLGINLATADSVILYDSDWNPQVDLQAQDRAHRIGQKKPVKVYRLVTEGTVEEKIVERAETKLHLDAMVIQQGKLVDQNQGLSKQDVLNMIRFGADAIFSAKEAHEITDEDIDAILAYGEKKTKELEAKLENHKQDLLDWATSAESGSLYNFEGVDYKEIKSNNRFIDIGKRTRNQNAVYNEAEYYRNKLSGPRKPSKPRALKAPKQPVIHPFQFYPPKLTKIFDKETDLWKRKCELMERKNSGEEIDDKEIDLLELTDKEKKEREKLLAKGFGNWRRGEYNQFIKACAEFGRDNLLEIANAIPSKTKEETEAYSKVFWKRHKELPDWESKVTQIEKGEAKKEQHKARILALEAKIERSPHPWVHLDIRYGSGGRGNWTPEEDIFLLCATYKEGYGNWDAVKALIDSSWQFKFDYFFKSKTQDELEKRCNTLLRFIEKEFQDDGIDLQSHAQNRPSPQKRKIWADSESEEEEEAEEKEKEEEEVEEKEKKKVEKEGKPESVEESEEEEEEVKKGSKRKREEAESEDDDEEGAQPVSKKARA